MANWMKVLALLSIIWGHSFSEGHVYLYILRLSRLPYRQMVQTLSKGSLLIIGLHIAAVHRVAELLDRMWGEDLFFL